MIVVDVNLLLYAVFEDAPQHPRSRVWLEEILSGDETVALSVLTIFGFVRIATNPRIAGAPMPVDVALQYARGWLEREIVTVLHPGPRHLDIAFELLELTGTGGNLTTDVQLAALAIEHQAAVYSNDSDFAKFPGLRCVNPLA